MNKLYENVAARYVLREGLGCGFLSWARTIWTLKVYGWEFFVELPQTSRLIETCISWFLGSNLCVYIVWFWFVLPHLSILSECFKTSRLIIFQPFQSLNLNSHNSKLTPNKNMKFARAWGKAFSHSIWMVKQSVLILYVTKHWSPNKGSILQVLVIFPMVVWGTTSFEVTLMFGILFRWLFLLLSTFQYSVSALILPFGSIWWVFNVTFILHVSTIHKQFQGVRCLSCFFWTLH